MQGLAPVAPCISSLRATTPEFTYRLELNTWLFSPPTNSFRVPIHKLLVSLMPLPRHTTTLSAMTSSTFQHPMSSRAEVKSAHGHPTQTSLAAKDPTAMTPLHLAALHGRVDALGQLLQSGHSLSATDPQGQTVLHIAAQASSAEVVELLLKAGASCSVRDHHEHTPIFYAYQNPYPEILNCFLRCEPICGEGCSLTPEVVLKGKSKSSSCCSSSPGGKRNGQPPQTTLVKTV